MKVGDRVRLTQDFNNEPGILRKGSEGTILEITTSSIFNDQYHVLFDRIPEEFYALTNIKRGVTLPMYLDEIELIPVVRFEVTIIDDSGNRTVVYSYATARVVTDYAVTLAESASKLEIRKLSDEELTALAS